MLAGGAVGYRTKYQQFIAHSTTDAEWVSACDIGKMCLYFRSILDDLGIPQHDVTVIYEDNRGALFMANAQQTSSRSRHIDFHEFALVQWVEQDLLLLKAIHLGDNCADALTKALAKQLFYWHNDTIMGKRILDHLVEYIAQESKYRAEADSRGMPVAGDLSFSEPKIKGG